MRGRVKAIMPCRYFGWIASAIGDHFFLASELWDVVFDERLIGMPVTFTPEQEERGKVARDIHPEQA